MVVPEKRPPCRHMGPLASRVVHRLLTARFPYDNATEIMKGNQNTAVGDNPTLGQSSNRYSTLEADQINHQFLGVVNGSSPLVYSIPDSRFVPTTLSFQKVSIDKVPVPQMQHQVSDRIEIPLIESEEDPVEMDIQEKDKNKTKKDKTEHENEKSLKKQSKLKSQQKVNPEKLNQKNTNSRDQKGQIIKLNGWAYGQYQLIFDKLELVDKALKSLFALV
ncbi:hypothetical protein Tco_0302593 [Tanacetum coccineum]